MKHEGMFFDTAAWTLRRTDDFSILRDINAAIYMHREVFQTEPNVVYLSESRLHQFREHRRASRGELAAGLVGYGMHICNLEVRWHQNPGIAVAIAADGVDPYPPF